MKTGVFYKNFFNTTKKYADFFSKNLQVDEVKIDDNKDELLNQYENIVLISGTNSTWKSLINFLNRNWNFIKDKNIIVIAVESVTKNGKNKLKLPANLRSKISFFKFPGKSINMHNY